jgi:hypothetical protein
MEQAVFDGRGAALVELALVGFGDHVVAQPQGHVTDGRQRRVQRLDATGVDGAHLLDDREEGVQLAEHRRLLGGLELQPRQMGDPCDVFGGQGHGEISPVRG